MSDTSSSRVHDFMQNKAGSGGTTHCKSSRSVGSGPVPEHVGAPGRSKIKHWVLKITERPWNLARYMRRRESERPT